MCGKCKYRFYRVICNGYNRPKAIEIDGGKTEMWKKTVISNTGAKRIEEVSNAFSLKRYIFSSSVSA
jgi:C4-type Zn-finger protein